MAEFRDFGCWIDGERIEAAARKIEHHTPIFIRGKKLQRRLLCVNASCRLSKAHRDLDDESAAKAEYVIGNSIHGERIRTRAESIPDPDKTRGSSTHNIQYMTLSKSARAEIVLPLRNIHQSISG